MERQMSTTKAAAIAASLLGAGAGLAWVFLTGPDWLQLAVGGWLAGIVTTLGAGMALAR